LILGFIIRKLDVKIDIYYIFGRRKSGFFDVRKLDSSKVNKGSISYKKLSLKKFRKTFLIERRSCSPLTTEVESLRTAKIL